jgi:hypothetical protein
MFSGWLGGTMSLKVTRWESGSRVKLVPWEEEVILTAEEAKILIELQEYAKAQPKTVVVPRVIFDKLVMILWENGI